MKIYSKSEFEGYVVSSITGFTDQSSTEIIAKALIGATTPSNTTVKLGVRGTQQIQLLNSAPVYQTGECGWNASGTTTFTQVSLASTHERLNEELCFQQLWDTYQSLLLPPGQDPETVPFLDGIIALKVKQIQQRIEDRLWNAKVASGDTFNGFYTLITTGATSVATSASGTTFSSTAAYGSNGNPITECDKLISALSDDALVFDDLVIFMSYSNFRLYNQALVKANFFQNYIGTSNVTGNMTAIHPSTNVKVLPTLGLNGSNKVTIGPAQYMFCGFDLMSDHEKMDAFWSRDFDVMKIRANYSYSAAIATFAGTNYFATNGLS
jgi:hypothetical protein